MSRFILATLVLAAALVSTNSYALTTGDHIELTAPLQFSSNEIVVHGEGLHYCAVMQDDWGNDPLLVQPMTLTVSEVSMELSGKCSQHSGCGRIYITFEDNDFIGLMTCEGQTSDFPTIEQVRSAFAPLNLIVP